MNISYYEEHPTLQDVVSYGNRRKARATHKPRVPLVAEQLAAWAMRNDEPLSALVAVSKDVDRCTSIRYVAEMLIPYAQNTVTQACTK